MHIQSIFVVLFTALAPVIIMGWYIYRKDQYKPEPLRTLLFCAFTGFLGGLLTSIITKSLLELPDTCNITVPSITSPALLTVMKTLGVGDLMMMLILAGIVLFNRFFDEQFDGIVYSVFVTLGFILCQNIIYLYANDFTLFDFSTLRALLLIPIYFFYAILSGYYLSRVCFRRPRWNWLLFYDLALFLFLPFLLHTLLTTLLLAFNQDLHIWQGILVFLILTYTCFLSMSFGIQRIESHLSRDYREGRVPRDNR